jgi:hypothetical protein
MIKRRSSMSCGWNTHQRAVRLSCKGIICSSAHLPQANDGRLTRYDRDPSRRTCKTPRRSTFIFCARRSHRTVLASCVQLQADPTVHVSACRAPPCSSQGPASLSVAQPDKAMAISSSSRNSRIMCATP